LSIKISHERRIPDRANLERIDHLILVAPARRTRATFPFADLINDRLRAPHTDREPVTIDLPNKRATQVSASRFKVGMSRFELSELARKHAAAHLSRGATRVAVLVTDMDEESYIALVRAVVAALLTSAYGLPQFKSKPREQEKPLREIVILGAEHRADLRRTIAWADGNNLARELTVLPPNVLTPASYRQRVARLARRHGWQMRFHDERALKRQGAGAFLAVAQGSPTRDAGIVHLRYRPNARAGGTPLALVGKGICYDTGGLNLKPPKHMHGMHEDMAGSAVALGTLLALTRLRYKRPVDCWLALAQNHIGPRAYQQNDIVTACDGTTIEVVHTDAEGRMVLADTLALVARTRPALIIDFATLTGACVYALSTRYSGAFTNRRDFVEKIIAAGQDSGERVWPFPMDEDFDRELDSKVADIKQCTLTGEADHILAARFLTRFASESPWIHVDLSAASHKGGLGAIASDTTGFGVGFALELILDKRVGG
jgi:leucyl aminopeptidase